jgi:hypothetical protein
MDTEIVRCESTFIKQSYPEIQEVLWTRLEEILIESDNFLDCNKKLFD